MAFFILPHWMPHGATSNQVEMQVMNHLVAMRTSVQDQTVPIISDSQVFGKFPDKREHFACQRFILLRKSVIIGDVFNGDDQEMDWCDRVDVFKSGHHFIFVNGFTGDVTSNDLTKYAIRVVHDFLLIDSSFDELPGTLTHAWLLVP
jgi:hypothetical protein